jgi:hypothetical protein
MAAVGFLGWSFRHERRITDPLFPVLLHAPQRVPTSLTLITATTTPAMYLATPPTAAATSFRPGSCALPLPGVQHRGYRGIDSGPIPAPAAVRDLVSGFVGIATGAMVLTTLHGTRGRPALASFALMGPDLARLPSPRPTREPAVARRSRSCSRLPPDGTARATNNTTLQRPARQSVAIGSASLELRLRHRRRATQPAHSGRVNWARKIEGALRARRSAIGDQQRRRSSEGRVTTGRAGKSPLANSAPFSAIFRNGVLDVPPALFEVSE